MADWIDKQAEKDKLDAENNRTQEELRLHKAKVINAKAQEFYDALVERLQADSAKLRETSRMTQSPSSKERKMGDQVQTPWRIINSA